MNEFLDTVVLDNPVRQYLIVAAIIFFVLVAKRLIAHYLAGAIFNIIKLRWKTLDANTFRTLVVKPLGLFLAVFITLIALDKLVFPSQLNFSVYRINIREILYIIGTAALIISFFLFLIRCIDFIGLMVNARFAGGEHRSRSQVIFFFKDFVKMLLGLLAIILILKYCFNYDVKGLVTGLSIVGAAVALALKENLENFIASIVIFFDKPFTVGDVVKVNNISGTVEKIGFRSTRIRSDDKTYITVPNKKMSDSVLDNLSDRLQRRYTLRLEISPATPHQKIQQLLMGLKDIVKKDEIQNSTVFVTDITPDAIVVITDMYTAPVALVLFNGIKETVIIQAVELLENLDIEIAGESTDVNIGTEKPLRPSSTKIL